MKKFLFITASLILFTLNASAFAETKIGIVDYNKVLLESPQRKKAESDFQNKFKKPQKALLNAQNKFQKDIETFSKNSPTMKADTKTKEEKKIIEQQKKLQEMQGKLQKDANAAQQKAFGDMVAKIKKTAGDIAAAKKIDLVVDKATLLYNKKELEITDEVIKQLKK